MSDWPEGFKAGFTCVVGRPNTGKSTLTNALVDRKIAITSGRPGTTRRVVKAIVNHESGRLILVDMPGLYRPRTLLGERLNDVVCDSLSDVDVIIMYLPADRVTDPGDRLPLSLVSRLASKKASIVAAVTRSDLVDRAALARRLQGVSELADFTEAVPVSTAEGDQVELPASLLIERMSESPPLYPHDVVTDKSEEALMTELMHGAALRDLRDEFPHSLAVTIDEIVGDRIHVSLHVRHDSRKGVVIGRDGTQLRRIRMRARKAIERLPDRKISLDPRVKMTKDWQRDPKRMGRLGF